MARPRNTQKNRGRASKNAGGSVRVRIGAQIRAARLAAGITQRELARRLKRSPAWVAGAEKGQRHLVVDDLPQIAAAVGLGVLDMLQKA